MAGDEKKKEDEKKKDEDKIVLEAHMHCENCRYKVYKAIIGYPGIEEINIDMKTQKVTLKGKVDAKKLFETAKKKSGGKVIKLLQFPEQKKEEKESKKEEKKEPKDVTVVLKVNIHCGACRKKVEKAIWNMPAVSSLKLDGDKATIVGKDLDAKKVCEEVIKRSGKHAEVVPPKKEKDDKKEGDKKKEEGEGDKKDQAQKEQKEGSKAITEYYVYAPQYFSDENPNACVLM